MIKEKHENRGQRFLFFGVFRQVLVFHLRGKIKLRVRWVLFSKEVVEMSHVKENFYTSNLFTKHLKILISLEIFSFLSKNSAINHNLRIDKVNCMLAGQQDGVSTRTNLCWKSTNNQTTSDISKLCKLLNHTMHSEKKKQSHFLVYSWILND